MKIIAHRHGLTPFRRRKKVGSLRDRVIREALSLRPLDGRLCPVAVVQLAPVPPKVKLIDVSVQMSNRRALPPARSARRRETKTGWVVSFSWQRRGRGRLVSMLDEGPHLVPKEWPIYIATSRNCDWVIRKGCPIFLPTRTVVGRSRISFQFRFLPRKGTAKSASPSFGLMMAAPSWKSSSPLHSSASR